ncbi:MAG: hypothetical protein ACODAD_06070, partial [Planctomycetota bacterium]
MAPALVLAICWQLARLPLRRGGGFDHPALEGASACEMSPNTAFAPVIRSSSRVCVYRPVVNERERGGLREQGGGIGRATSNAARCGDLPRWTRGGELGRRAPPR